MPHVHQQAALYSFADALPVGDGWKTISVEQFNTLRSSGWNPSIVPQTYRVSKDTLITRIAAVSDAKVEALDDLVQQQPKARRVLWRDFSWFWSDNQSVRQLVAAIGLKADDILAPAPWL